MSRLDQIEQRCGEAHYICPRCGRSAFWTDGLSLEAGDDRNEFWCQTCGAETPLEAMTLDDKDDRLAQAAALLRRCKIHLTSEVQARLRKEVDAWLREAS